MSFGGPGKALQRHVLEGDFLDLEGREGSRDRRALTLERCNTLLSTCSMPGATKAFQKEAETSYAVATSKNQMMSCILKSAIILFLQNRCVCFASMLR